MHRMVLNGVYCISIYIFCGFTSTFPEFDFPNCQHNLTSTKQISRLGKIYHGVKCPILSYIFKVIYIVLYIFSKKPYMSYIQNCWQNLFKEYLIWGAKNDKNNY